MVPRSVVGAHLPLVCNDPHVADEVQFDSDRFVQLGFDPTPLPDMLKGMLPGDVHPDASGRRVLMMS